MRLLICAFSFVFLSCTAPRPLNPAALAQENACVQSLQIEDFQGAQIRCELCLEYDESVAACMNGLGLVAYSRGNRNKAVSYFTKAIKQSKNFAQARNNLGVLYFKEDNFSGGIPYFSAAVEIDPGYEDARYNLGLSYLRMGQANLAKGASQKALENFKDSLHQYLKLIAINPAYVNGYRDLGVIFSIRASMQTLQAKREEDLKQATNYFQSCLQLDSTHETCLESFGQLLLVEHQYEAALQQFTGCLASNSKNAVCISGIDQSYQGIQFKSQALQDYVAQLKKDPKNADAHDGYCSILFENGMNDLAVSECQAAIALNPKLCSAYYQLGMYYKKTLNSPQSLTNCQSFALCPSSTKDPEQSAQCNRVITTLSNGQ
ncbi:MAG: tetratricopeptide repeat protein [Myxococcaceae bacterium]|nr:tetratricopeptide repeat protein [Myxococcaceae bacterium]MBH2006288.1 tetratricopeptide repeat protein [Myxococcaceae bacterium]